MAKIAPLNVPVTVDTSGMDKGIRDAERKMKRGAQKINAASTGGKGAAAAKGISMAGASTLGFGAAGGALGAAGGVGFAIGAVAAPFLAAARMAESLAGATKGATAQLEEFKKTGDVGAFGNKLMLETLSRMERAAQARVEGPTMAQGFFAAEKIAGGAGPTNTETFMDWWDSSLSTLGAILGGASWEEAQRITQALAAPEGAVGDRMRANMVSEQRALRSEGYSSFGEKPLSFLAESLFHAMLVPDRERSL